MNDYKICWLINELAHDHQANNSTWSLCSSYIKKQVLLNRRTGKLAFDNNGDRLFSEYEIINIDDNERPVRVGQYFYSDVISSQLLNLFFSSS